MAPRSKTKQLTDSILGQHLALAVAAGLARTQLIPDPLRVYDAQHHSDMLNIVARALARVAPLYVQDPKAGTARELSQEELQGADVRRGAIVMVLKDGRTLSSVTIKRTDLRQAIAILKTVGIQDVLPPANAAQPPPSPPTERADQMAQLVEAEQLLRGPLVPSQIDRANALVVSIARHAPQGRVANLAMQLVSAIHEARAETADGPDHLRMALARLHAALEEAGKAAD